MSPENIRVRVGLAPRAQPFDECMDSLYTAIRVAKEAGFRVTLEKVRGACPGFQNYGPVLSHLLQAGDTHLFVAADDIVFPPDTIVRLVDADKDVVSGIYRKNLLTSIEPANYMESEEEFCAGLKAGGLYETQYAAGHSMTIKRAVIEKMMADYPELAYVQGGQTYHALFLPMIHDRIAFQDDWAFSIRARRSGFTLWCEFGCRLKHFCSDFLGFEALEQ